MTTRTTMPPDHSRMPPRRGRPRATLVMTAGAVASVAVALAACSGGDPAPPPTSNQATAVISQPGPSPTPSPSVSIPANLTPAEAEAAANAVEVHKLWTAAYETLTSSGGRDLGLLKRTATQTALATGEQTASTYAVKGWRGVGSVTIRRVKVDAVKLTASGRNTFPEVALTTCVDASASDVLDAQGKSVVEIRDRIYEEKVWVRYFPRSDYPQVGEGVNRWLVSQDQNRLVDRC